MTTDIHPGHGADRAGDLRPDDLPDPDGSNLLPVPAPPYGTDPAETALLPAVVDEDAPAPPAPTADTPAPLDAAVRVPECVVGPLATVGDLCRWLSEATRAGQPSSVSVSAGSREAVVHFPDARTFDGWMDWYGIRDVEYTRDVLGEVAEGIITMSGWVLRLRLSGPAVEELS